MNPWRFDVVIVVSVVTPVIDVLKTAFMTYFAQYAFAIISHY